jgi:hypothetical protein
VTDDLAVFSTNDFIVTILDITAAEAIFAMTLDDIVKILNCRYA